MLYVPASVALPVVPVVSIADPVGAVYPCDIVLPVYVYAFTGLPGTVIVAFAIVTIPIYFAATPLWFPSASTFDHTKYVPAFVPVTLVFHEVGAVVLFAPSPYFIVPPDALPALDNRLCAFVLYTNPVANVGVAIVAFTLFIVNAFVFPDNA